MSQGGELQQVLACQQRTWATCSEGLLKLQPSLRLCSGSEQWTQTGAAQSLCKSSSVLLPWVSLTSALQYVHI